MKTMSLSQYSRETKADYVKRLLTQDMTWRKSILRRTMERINHMWNQIDTDSRQALSLLRVAETFAAFTIQEAVRVDAFFESDKYLRCDYAQQLRRFILRCKCLRLGRLNQMIRFPFYGVKPRHLGGDLCLETIRQMGRRAKCWREEKATWAWQCAARDQEWK